MGQVIATGYSAMAISQDERNFFVELGQRIAKLRKELKQRIKGLSVIYFGRHR
jgi:hypothetical protein